MAQTKIGVVISDKMEKTVVVKISTKVKHPLYKKQITRSKNLKAHDEIGAKTGDKVKIAQTKPYSKSIAFKVMEVIKK
ncbi:MAG: 30S ribosomal protein S17 [Candidatus Curtissbacteria bacterium GW2011_GWA1_40_9]|uniref:Small ribosomal subunit protein uS17 n=1 Tax=Candidatus Curtissbacteria bacterium GW2011_GWA1_40_9 TaxID=1618408 RepID=A0A0G0TT57_9BACT|nr:MAG: 30S ribosomal protein S17 [Candidatus Curtissbacteria bacterium GW2011_GWA1_40_9]